MDITQRMVLETEGIHGADVRGWNGEAARQEALEYEREMERAYREEMERYNNANGESDMFNLMEMGLKAQEATVKANRDAEVFRIVSSDETLHAVMIEAISKSAFVWANAELKRTVISKVKPNGEGWVKVHGTYNQYNWLWQYRDTNSMPVIQQFVESADDDNDAALAQETKA